MGVDEAVACGLIVNELVSNSLKYAFPDGRSGSVRVSLEMKGRAYQLTVSDNGIGLPEGAVTGEDGTLGLQLVRTLADQLRGAVEIGTLGGTEFRITFPERERTG
jgi:two-component sensor histidine kinase